MFCDLGGVEKCNHVMCKNLKCNVGAMFKPEQNRHCENTFKRTKELQPFLRKLWSNLKVQCVSV